MTFSVMASVLQGGGGQAAAGGGPFEPFFPGLIVLLPLIGFLINGYGAFGDGSDARGGGKLASLMVFGSATNSLDHSKSTSRDLASPFGPA